MGRWTILALRGVIAASLAGSVLVQTVLVPIIWADLSGEALAPRIALVVILVAGVMTLQVSAVCVWRLLTFVRRGSVFSPRSFRYVDTIAYAVSAGAVLLFALAGLLAPGEMAPGVVALIGGAGVVTAGVALLVVVMRRLLVLAVERESEVLVLRSELSEVI